ncbi:MAG: Nitroreductase family protein [Candidatus Phytoplasma pruni]|nr:Nitroreductase family protein [Candidatus Phytoplasma pruni]
MKESKMKIKTVRLFEKDQKINKETWDKIFQDIRFTPSSFDLQPWRFFVIESQENKNKLKTCLKGNLTQLETSSAMVLLFGDLNKAKNSEYIYQQKWLNNEITLERKELVLKQIKENYFSMQENKLHNELFLEGGIVGLNFVATLQKFDYNGGFIGGCKFDQVNELFDIPSNYLPLILISVGKEKLFPEGEKGQKKTPFKLKPEDFVNFL